MFDLLFGNKAVLVPAIIVIAVLIICILGYIKAPPDMAYIISGLRKKPKSSLVVLVSVFRFWSASIS